MVHVLVVTQTLRHHSESPVLYQELLDQEIVVRISGPIIFIWPTLPLSTPCQQSQPHSSSDLLYKLVHIYPYLGEFKFGPLFSYRLTELHPKFKNIVKLDKIPPYKDVEY